MMRATRYRLLTIVLLAVVTSALSIVALVRMLSVTNEQRHERAREAVNQQVARLAAAPGTATLADPPAMAIIGMRGGYLDGPRALAELLPEWRGPLDEARSRSVASGGRILAEQPLGAARLIVGVQPAGPARMAWAGFLVQPPQHLRTWQTIVILLAIATALLVATTVSAVIAFKRSAAALHGCLLALADDLSTPIPRPRIRELGEVADGIARLAHNLAQSHKVQERLSRELSEKERLAALGRVVTGVAHEVRNPLASIKLRLDLAAAGAPLPDAAARAIGHASEEISRLDRLVADLLMVGGRQSGPRRRTSLGTLVRARIEALSPWSASRHVAISADGDADAAIDPESVARAVDNLLRNAVEASPLGGLVTVSVQPVREAVLVRVEDRGSGVTQRAAELFEPFFTTKADGTGLGLAISRTIARLHGGDVIYSRQDEVTRFELSLARDGGGADMESAA